MDDQAFVLANLGRYEDGELEDKDVLELFAALIRTGGAWRLQGFYGRRAAGLIEEGVISEKGKINWIKATSQYGRR